MACSSLLIACIPLSAKERRPWSVSLDSVQCFNPNSIARTSFNCLTEKFKNSSIMDTRCVVCRAFARAPPGNSLCFVLCTDGVLVLRPAWRPKIFYSSGEHIGLPEPFPGMLFYVRLVDSALTRSSCPPLVSVFARPCTWCAASTMRRARRSIAAAPSGGLHTQLHQHDNYDSKHNAFFHHGRA